MEYVLLSVAIVVVALMTAHYATRQTRKPVKQVMREAERLVGPQYPPATYGGSPHKPYGPPVMPKGVITSQPVSRPKPSTPKKPGR